MGYFEDRAIRFPHGQMWTMEVKNNYQVLAIKTIKNDYNKYNTHFLTICGFLVYALKKEQ